MKTNRTARWTARIRIVALCLIVATIGGIEFGLSQSLANRIGQVSVHQADNLHAPNVSISDLMAAAR